MVQKRLNRLINRTGVVIIVNDGFLDFSLRFHEENVLLILSRRKRCDHEDQKSKKSPDRSLQVQTILLKTPLFDKTART